MPYLETVFGSHELRSLLSALRSLLSALFSLLLGGLEAGELILQSKKPYLELVLWRPGAALCSLLAAHCSLLSTPCCRGGPGMLGSPFPELKTLLGFCFFSGARSCSPLSALCSLLSALYSLLCALWEAWEAWELILRIKSLTWKLFFGGRCSQEKFLNRLSSGRLHIVAAVLSIVRCVLQGRVFNRHSLGHLLMADAVWSNVRCVLKGNTFLIDTPWGISSWWTLRCGTDAVSSRGVLFQIDALWGTSSLWTLCCGTYAAHQQEVF